MAETKTVEHKNYPSPKLDTLLKRAVTKALRGIDTSENISDNGEHVDELTLFILQEAQSFADLINLKKLQEFIGINNKKMSVTLDRLHIEGLLRNPLIVKEIAQKILIGAQNNRRTNLRPTQKQGDIRRSVSEKIKPQDFTEDFFNALTAYHAKKDALTGLDRRENIYEHARFMEKMGQEAVLVFLDFDNFKQINDTFGHDVGDRVIQLFSQICKDEWENFREYDRVGRYGGDEFIMLFFINKNQSAEDREALIKKIKYHVRKIGENFLQQVSELKAGVLSNQSDTIGQIMGLSIGITSQNGNSIGKAIGIADEQMYEAKKEKIPGKITISTL